MDKESILINVQNIFRDVLDDDSIVLSTETTATDIGEWDSLTHIQLVVAIEKYFKLRFSSKEISNWKNVGEMLDSIAKK